MRPALFAIPVFAFAALGGHAQMQAPAAKTFPTPKPAAMHNVLTFTGMSGCPVGMSAQQSGGGEVLWTISAEDARDSGVEIVSKRAGSAGVHVQLDTHKVSTIRQVELAVYYLAPGTRFLPVQETLSESDRKKTYTLSSHDGAAFRLAGDLLVGQTAGITRVHLLSIDYANGTSWHAGPDSVCSVEPIRIVTVTKS